MSSLHTVKFSPKSESVRGVITSHREWIEAVLGVPLSSTVAISTDLPITQIGVPMVLGYHNEHDPEFRLVGKLLAHIPSVQVPPHEQAHVKAEAERDDDWSDQSRALIGTFVGVASGGCCVIESRCSTTAARFVSYSGRSGWRRSMPVT
jgi:hypothetical protein